MIGKRVERGRQKEEMEEKGRAGKSYPIQLH